MPDAVRLTDTTHPNHPYNVAVVYPHQIEFGNAAGTNPRKFDLRIATCSLDVSQPTPQVSSDNTYLPFDTGVQFNGAVSPGTIPSPGLILPDLAPSSEENAFWAVHERQSKKTVTLSTGGTEEVAEGKVKLQYFKLQSSGEWEAEATKTFKTSSSSEDYAWRRRPMISSYTGDTTEHAVSLAFSITNSHPEAADKSGNVVFEHWEYEDGGLINPATFDAPSPIFLDWPNQTGLWDDRPAPLMGRSNPFIRRCYSLA